MARKIRMRRFAEFTGLGTAALAVVLAWSPAGVAQEKEEERLAADRYHPAYANARPILGILVKPSADHDGGLRVTGVMEDWPAEGVGIRDDDIIVSIGGHDLAEPLEDEEERGFSRSWSLPEQRLRTLVKEVPEGEAVEVTVERDGETLTFMVVPELHIDEGVWPPPGRLNRWTWSPDSVESMEQWRELSERIREQTERFRVQFERIRERPRVYAPTTGLLPGGRLEVRWDGTRLPGGHGLDLVELNPGLGSYFGTERGVLVADIEDDSPLGLRPGDVVVAVEGRQVDDSAELHRILGSYEDDEEIRFRIRRDGAETTVTGTIN